MIAARGSTYTFLRKAFPTLTSLYIAMDRLLHKTRETAVTFDAGSCKLPLRVFIFLFSYLHFYYMYKYIIFKGIRKFESSVIFCNGPFIFHVFPKLFFFTIYNISPICMKFKSTRYFLNKKANSTKNGLSVGVHASNRHGDFF